MNNYQKKARDQVLRQITIKCKECKCEMIEIIDLYDSSIVGYSCPDCPNYVLYQGELHDEDGFLW